MTNALHSDFTLLFFFFCSFPFSTVPSFTTETALANAAHCNTFDCFFLNENHRRRDDK